MDKIDLRDYCQQPHRITKKGRSESRILCRDEKMMTRFYYYSEIKKLKYNIILSRLSEEFNIDENVVRCRMKIGAAIIDKLYVEKPSVFLLRKRYPYFCW